MQFWDSVTWDVARAGGFTAYGLLTLSVVLGLALSLHWQSARWPRLINNELHNHVTLLSVVFLIVHVAAIWIDPFTNFSASAVFVPFMSSYRTLWMSLGIVALYLGIAIGISTLLRSKIGYRAWRQFHTLTLLLYTLATVHGIFTGSDTKQLWTLAMYIVSVGLVSTLFVLRLSHSAVEAQKQQSRREQVQARQAL